MKCRLFLFFVVCGFNVGFAQNNIEIKPEYNNEKIVLEKKPSIIAIPFDISMEDIQKQINAKMPDLIYEDNSFDDNDKDELKAKVWRKGNLTFTGTKDNVFSYQVPLKIWAQKRISAFGMSQTPATEFEIIIKFSSKFNVLTDYSVQTITNANGFVWVSKPVLKTGVIDIPMGPVIGKIIDNNQAKFAAQIDKAIGESLSLKPYMLEAWNTAKVPKLISEEYNTWLKITPLETYLVPLKADQKSLKSTIGFKIIVETLVGNPTEKIENAAQLPNLKLVNSIPDIFEVSLFNIITFPEATRISKNMFLGQKYDFKEGKYNIEITDMDIYGNDQYLVLKTTTKGSFKGTIYVKGIPKYDPIKKQVVLTQTELDVKTKNFLHKSAAWLLEGVLVKKIEQDFGMPLTEIMNTAKTSTEQTINSEFAKGVNMKGNVISIDPKDIKISEKGIVALVNAKAKVELIVKGL